MYPNKLKPSSVLPDTARKCIHKTRQTKERRKENNIEGKMKTEASISYSVPQEEGKPHKALCTKSCSPAQRRVLRANHRPIRAQSQTHNSSEVLLVCLVGGGSTQIDTTRSHLNELLVCFRPSWDGDGQLGTRPSTNQYKRDDIFITRTRVRGESWRRREKKNMYETTRGRGLPPVCSPPSLYIPAEAV
jgi:hypothetical protein